MKKVVLSLIAVAFLVASCGPSSAELKEKAIADSIRMSDSISMVQTEQQKLADSIALVQKAKDEADSLAKIKPIKGKK